MCLWQGVQAVVRLTGVQDDAVDNETALQIRETTSAFAYGLLILPLAGSVDLLHRLHSLPANSVVFIAALAGTMFPYLHYRQLNAILNCLYRGIALNREMRNIRSARRCVGTVSLQQIG